MRQPLARIAHGREGGRLVATRRPADRPRVEKRRTQAPLAAISSQHAQLANDICPDARFMRGEPKFWPAPCRLSRQAVRMKKKRLDVCGVVWRTNSQPGNERRFQSHNTMRVLSRADVSSSQPISMHFCGGVCPSIRQNKSCWLFVTHNMQRKPSASTAAGRSSLFLSLRYAISRQRIAKASLGLAPTCGNGVISLFRSYYSSRLSFHHHHLIYLLQWAARNRP